MSRGYLVLDEKAAACVAGSSSAVMRDVTSLIVGKTEDLEASTVAVFGRDAQAHELYAELLISAGFRVVYLVWGTIW